MGGGEPTIYQARQSRRRMSRGPNTLARSPSPADASRDGKPLIDAKKKRKKNVLASVAASLAERGYS